MDITIRGNSSGDYFVIDQSSWATVADGHVAVHRVKEVIRPSNIAFPAANGTVCKEPPDGDDAEFVPTPYNDGDESDAASECSQAVAAPRSNDYWEIRGDILVRVHVDPRRRLFTPVHGSDA